MSTEYIQWKYHSEHYKHYLQTEHSLPPYNVRLLVLNLYDLLGTGGIDYQQYGLEYGFDVCERLKYMKFEDFYDDQNIKWFFRKYEKQIWIKEKTNIVMAKLLMEQ